MMVKHTKDDPIYFTHYDADAFQHIIDTQSKVIEFQKKTKT